jgi:hypothetical protein
MKVSPTIFKRYVSALDITKVREASLEERKSRLGIR